MVKKRWQWIVANRSANCYKAVSPIAFALVYISHELVRYILSLPPLRSTWQASLQSVSAWAIQKRWGLQRRWTWRTRPCEGFPKWGIPRTTGCNTKITWFGIICGTPIFENPYMIPRCWKNTYIFRYHKCEDASLKSSTWWYSGDILG